MKVLRILSLLMAVSLSSVSLALAVVCPQCGYDNPDEYNYCIKCGYPLTSEAVLQREQKENAQKTSLPAPKKTIAVSSFTNSSGIGSYINLGDDFSAQLTDSLIQSDKFIVVSRTELANVLSEQDLKKSGRMAASESAQTGKVIPAQILITGNITEFDQNKESGGQGLSISGVTIGAKKSNAHIAVILQIIDSTTGEVLDSKRVEGEARASGFSIGYEGSWSIGSSSFKETPLGKATQIAIDRAVVYIADKLDDIPWQGRVVTVKDSIVYLNAGKNAGISPGQTFSVYRKGQTLVDPETGIELGSEKTRIGEITVSEVEDKFSKANIVSAEGSIQRSDIVLEN